MGRAAIAAVAMLLAGCAVGHDVLGDTDVAEREYETTTVADERRLETTIEEEAPVSTTLSSSVSAGATELTVASEVGFTVGCTVEIEGGGNKETGVVAGFGSLILSSPLVHSYPADTTTVTMTASATAAPTPAPTPTPTHTPTPSPTPAPTSTPAPTAECVDDPSFGTVATLLGVEDSCTEVAYTGLCHDDSPVPALVATVIETLDLATIGSVIRKYCPCACEAVKAMTCLRNVHLPEGKPPKLPHQRKNVTTEGGQSMPLGLTNFYWASSRILANVMKIIAEEALGYHTIIAENALSSSHTSVYALGNCPTFTANCLESEKALDPQGAILSQYHFGFEIWENYFRPEMDNWNNNYPEKAPEEIGSVGYVGEEGLFANPISISEGLTEDKLLLDYYRGYDASVFEATEMSKHFVSIDDIDGTMMMKCTDLMKPNDEGELAANIHDLFVKYHAQFPNDTSIKYVGAGEPTSKLTSSWEWDCYEDTWWLSPACRNAGAASCIPMLTQSLYGKHMFQQANYFNMPVAIAVVNSEGGATWNSKWKGIVEANKLGTYWWYPDDMLINSDMKVIRFPPYNKEQYEQGLQVSQWQAIPLRKLMARGFSTVAADAALLARELWVPETNMVAMFKRSVAGDSIYDLACGWVRDNTDLWHSWLPGELECNPGQGLVNAIGTFLLGNVDAVSCDWCPPGMVPASLNGTKQTICEACPKGQFQKSPGQTECESCPAGKFADTTGSTACTDCALGSFAEGTGKSVCTSCSAHETTTIRAAQIEWDCVCDEGYFRALGHSEEARTDCKACPSGMECETGNGVPKVTAGFWVSEQNGIDREYSVYRCRDEMECPGGEAGACAAGRDASEIGCASCMPDHHRSSKGECKKCEGSAWLPLIGVIVLVICGLIGVAIFARVDVTKIRMNTVSVAICMSQTVMIVQTMSLFFTMKIEWIEPVRSMFSTFSVAAFNFSALNLSCGVSDSDVVSNYALRLLSFPFGLSLLCIIFAILHFVIRKPISRDHVINSIGVLTLVLFLILNMTALTPFQCISSPNGTSSLSANPAVICYEDSEWTVMAVMGSFAVLIYGVGFFSVALYVTVKYPALVLSTQGSIVMSRYRFMFQRFTARCFYFTPIYLLRTLFIALIPVVFADYGHRQMIFLVLTFVVFSLIHAKYQPWRGAIPNMLDIWVMACMILLLTCSSLLLEVKEDEMVADLEVFFTIIMVFVFGAIGIFLVFLAYRRFVPKDKWAALLCHIPDTAVTARWIKMEMEKRKSQRDLFLPADHLDWTVEEVFDLLRCQQADKLVVLLSGGTLSSPECAGQITTAYTNGVPMVAVALDGHTELCDDDLDETAIAKRWSAEAFQRCTAEGISLGMVKTAYSALRGTAKISCCLVANRLANSHGTTLQAIAKLSSVCALGDGGELAPEKEGEAYDVAVMADVCDPEAIALAEVLKGMIGAFKTGWSIKGVMTSSEVSQAATPSQLLLVVLTRGCLGSEMFMQTATAALQAWPSVPTLTARSDDFSFPTKETMEKVLAPQIAKGAEIPQARVAEGYLKIAESPGAPIVAHARLSSLEKQVGYLVSCAEEAVGPAQVPSTQSC